MGWLSYLDGASVQNATVHTWSIGNVAYLFAHGLPRRITDAMLQATFAVEERLRLNFTDDSSSLPCRGAHYFACPPVAGQAAATGNRKKALRLLRRAQQNYTLLPYHLLREYSSYNFGMYMTHAGRSKIQTNPLRNQESARGH